MITEPYLRMRRSHRHLGSVTFPTRRASGERAAGSSAIACRAEELALLAKELALLAKELALLAKELRTSISKFVS